VSPPSFGRGGTLAPPFFLFLNAIVYFSFIVAPYLFFGVHKKVCFIFFCGFCNFGRCKLGKKTRTFKEEE
jgi:hypothetical protein